MERQKTVKLEINLQDTEVRVYTDFKEIKGGYAVLSGKNKKSLNSEWLGDSGKIEDGDGVEMEYVPFLNTSSPGFKKRIKRLERASAFPVGSSIWLAGRFIPGKKTWHGRTSSRISTYDIGEEEEPIESDLLE